MLITLELPDNIAKELETRWTDLPRAALESLKLEACRSHVLSAAQFRRLLGFKTRLRVDTFLKEHEVQKFHGGWLRAELRDAPPAGASEAQR
jgi:hypothetical protein